MNVCVLVCVSECHCVWVCGECVSVSVCVCVCAVHGNLAVGRLAPEICLPRLSLLGSQKSAALDPGTGEQGTRAVLLVPTEEGSGSSLPLFFSENELYGLEVSWQGLLPE